MNLLNKNENWNMSKNRNVDFNVNAMRKKRDLL